MNKAVATLVILAATMLLPQAYCAGQEKDSRQDLPKNARNFKSGQQAKASIRINLDKKSFSEAELSEIEALYQAARKEWDSPKGRKSLKALIAGYPQSNRTGCAILYYAMMNKGEKRVNYVQDALNGFEDCYYPEGVQVGAYARFLLAATYMNSGKKVQAQEILDELRAKYPEAVTFKGESVISIIEKKSWWQDYD